MFHLHILGALEDEWLREYSGSKYSNEIMGKWFLQYSRKTKLHICFINHPVYPA